MKENGISGFEDLFDFRLDLDTDDELESEVEVIEDMELDELDEVLGKQRDVLEKGGVRRYETRVPTGNPRRPWRYIYPKAAGSRRKAHGRVEHLVVGARIKGRHNGKEGHWHVEKASKHHVHITHSHTGQTVKMKKADAAAMLAKHPATQARSDRAKAAHAARKGLEKGGAGDLSTWAVDVLQKSQPEPTK